MNSKEIQLLGIMASFTGLGWVLKLVLNYPTIVILAAVFYPILSEKMKYLIMGCSLFEILRLQLIIGDGFASMCLISINNYPSIVHRVALTSLVKCHTFHFLYISTVFMLWFHACRKVLTKIGDYERLNTFITM